MKNKTNNKLAIEVDIVNKTFKLPHEKQNSLKSLFVNLFSGKRTFERQHVLKDISFEVEKGEFFGIVGKNGSGKSTLLKLLAGIYTPDSGRISINGKLTPFIELGVGFNAELTGRENIFLNGALLGFNRKQMEAMYDDIVEFAELERFMDQKLKNYSSGMQVRLAFSIAIRANTDILLVDEVLAVGDASFQQKCFEVFAELKKQGTTIVLVTHDMSAVLRFCDRVIMIEKGAITAEGKPTKVADSYLELNYEVTERNNAKKKTSNEINDEKATMIDKVLVKDASGDVSHRFKPGDKITVEIYFNNPNAVSTHFGFQIFNEAGVYCFGTNTKNSGASSTNKKSGKVEIVVDAELAPGTYYVTAASMNQNATIVTNYRSKIADFRMLKDRQAEGVAVLKHTWKI